MRRNSVATWGLLIGAWASDDLTTSISNRAARHQTGTTSAGLAMVSASLAVSQLARLAAAIPLFAYPAWLTSVYTCLIFPATRF
jgi:hypothetical protein